MNYNTSGNSVNIYNSINSNGVSRAIQEANDRKARKLTFYKNGEPFSNGITVSIMPGKDFKTMEQLCSYLTNKIPIVNGVQYIFTPNGQRIDTLNELEHGQVYVVSGLKQFQKYPYGQINKLKLIGGGAYSNQLPTKYKNIREDDLKLLRPLSSKFNTVYHSVNQPINTSYKEGRIITIINNKDHKLKSRVLLNLKSPKSFEIIVRDLGQAVRIRNAKRMFTVSGQEVRSVSQLKRDMIGIELFYLDSANSKYSPVRVKSQSLESIHKMNGIQDSLSSIEFNADMNEPKRISRNDSAPDVNELNKFSRLDSSNYSRNYSDINPSRRGESGLSEKVSFNIDSILESDSNSFKASETQTSPEFVKASRRNAKKMVKLEKEKSFTNEPKNNQNNEVIEVIEETIVQTTNNHQLSNTSPKKVENKNVSKNPLRNNPKTNTLEKVNKTVVENSDKTKPKENIKKTNTLVADSDSIRREALQEYADTLLRETAFMVQSDSFRQDSDINEVKKNTIRNTPKPLPKKLPNNPIENSESKIHTKKENFPNEVINSKNPKDTESEEEENVPNPGSTLPKTTRRENVANNTVASNNPSPYKKSNNPSPTRKIEVQSIDLNIKKHINNPDFVQPNENLRHGVDIPDKFLKLKWVHGYNGSNAFKNLLILANGDLAFFVGTVAILWNPEDNIQRLYTQHTQDIRCMALRKNRNIVATSQEAGKGNPYAAIRVWSAKDLRTYAFITKNIFGSLITDMSFSLQGFLLVVNSEGRLNLTVWDWKNSEIIGSSSKELINDESVKGAIFHQTEEDIIVTYGKKHLTLWQRRRDGSIDSRTAIKPLSKAAKCINCVDFLPDHSLLTGDTNGTLTIWAPLEDENGVLEFVVKEVKGHEKSLTSLQLMPNNILISGDYDGTIKTWDVNEGQFRLLNAIKLPPTSGSICSITMAHYQDRESDTIEIYVGTSMNLILRGSALQASNYTVIFEGHAMAVRGLAVDPKQEFFYTAGLDQKICKWSDSALVWRTTTEFQCVSSAVHPSGTAMAAGSVSGTIFIISTSDGSLISQLPVSQVCIGCLSYSPDGDLLAAGCQDGVLYVLPVYDNGFAYEKVSVLRGPFAILSLQWSIDSQFILTSVNDHNYQELVLWDLPHCRYLRGGSSFSDSVIWFDATCSGGEDVRGIWDNQYLQDVVNLSCHCSPSRKYLVSGDEEGFLRLFSYPCPDSKAAFFEYKQGGGSVTEAKFAYSENFLISSNYDGALFVWELLPFDVSDEIQDN